MWSLYIVYHFWILFLFVCLLEKSRRNFSFTKHTLNARFAAVRTHTQRERERTREREKEKERERERERILLLLLLCIQTPNPIHKKRLHNKSSHQIIESKTNHYYRIFSGLVPVCAATNFFKSPMVSSSLHFTRIFFPKRSFKITSIICILLVFS